MADWFSEDAVERLRHTVRTFKRFHGLSNARLSEVLGDQRFGPSASTLARFLEEGALSLRHASAIRCNLQSYVEENAEGPDTNAFVQSCANELEYFEIDTFNISSSATSAFRLEGKFIFARRFPTGELLFSLIIFVRNRPFECVAYRLSNHGTIISMPCQIRMSNSRIYLEGQNPVNNSIRFMCFSKYGPSNNVLTGVMAGFENHDTPFAARACLVKIADDTNITPEIHELQERNSFEDARGIFASIAIDPGPAIEAINTCRDEGYLAGQSMHI